MSKHEEIFKHSPLAPGRNIRILGLEPSRDFDSDIRCRLIEPSLDEARGGYEALSYVWGSQICDLKITCNDRPFYVTTNCLLALRYLRQKAEVRFLWVDAICIDQSSNAERGHQVELMGEIYKFANNVIIWLGEQQPGTRRAFQRAHNFYRLTRVTKKAKALVDGRNLPPVFLPLLSHAWFQRVWTFQELLMASRATVHCGHCSIPWEAFVARVEPAMFRGDEADSLCENVAYTNIARFLWQVESRVTDRQAPVIPINNGHRTCYDASNPTLAGHHHWLVIIALLWLSTRQRSASEPLDRLYGLYGLFRNMGFGLPRPDYHKTVLQVAQELTFSFVVISRSLMPLYCFVAQRFSSGGPSWALDWERFKGEHTNIRAWGIKEANHATFRNDFRPSFDESRLGLEGILYGTLHPFGTPVPNGEANLYIEHGVPLRLAILNWLQKMLDLTKAFQICPNGQLAWEALFIAYFKGYHLSGSSRSMLESMTLVLLQCGMVLSQLPRHVDLLKDGSRGPVPKQLHMLNEDELYAYVRDDAIMGAFTEKLIKTAQECSDGTLFRTSEGWIGVTMCPFQPSDLLALLHGSSVPAILRPMGEYYQLVGFVSVQGIPDSARPINGNEEGLQSIVLI